MLSVSLDKDTCMGCGVCWTNCPEGFKAGQDGKAQLIDESADCVALAADSCPVNAIIVND